MRRRKIISSSARLRGLKFLENVAKKFGRLSRIEAVALSGSRTAEGFDEKSDFDFVYHQPQWLEEQIERVHVTHQAWVGYSACFWHNLLTSKILFDRSGWLAGLQQRARQPCPRHCASPSSRRTFRFCQKILRKTAGGNGSADRTRHRGGGRSPSCFACRQRAG